MVCSQEPAAKRPGKEFSTQAAGIGGILSRLDETRESEAAITRQAFSNMTELMNNAKQIVSLGRVLTLCASWPLCLYRSSPICAAGENGGNVRCTPRQDEGRRCCCSFIHTR